MVANQGDLIAFKIEVFEGDKRAVEERVGEKGDLVVVKME